MHLHGQGVATGVDTQVIGRVTTQPILSHADRKDHIIFVSKAPTCDLTGYAGALTMVPTSIPMPTVTLPENLAYLSDGDVVRFTDSGHVSVLYRKNSQNNTILTTENCNSRCLMCSQPPRDVDDTWRVPMILRLIELIHQDAQEIIISGGEPTLLGSGFLQIIDKFAHVLPRTSVHVLTNGRNFKDPALAYDLANIQHPDLMLGIPLYADTDHLHDYIVQAKGAWEETIEGLYNLAALGMRLEIRVVVHQQSLHRLSQLASFICRNLPFAQHVALMGLEMFGYTPRNLPLLWADPGDYARTLEVATKTLALGGMNVSIYNHQLCTLPRSLWAFSRKSISDWKNVYIPECEPCEVRQYCGGFFQSAGKRHSAHITPVRGLTSNARRALDELHGGVPPIETTLLSAHG